MLSAVPYVLLFVLLWGKVSIAVIEPHTTRTLTLLHVEENDFYKTKDRKNLFAWTSMKNRNSAFSVPLRFIAKFIIIQTH